jgi:hypothetical protein
MALRGKKRIGGAIAAAVAVYALGLLAVPAIATGPPAPVLTSTNPPSPSKTAHILVIGTAQAGSTVNVYPNGDCSGPPYPSGSAATFASPGIAIQVPDDSTTTLSATATDASDNVSPCSAPIAFVEDSRPPNTSINRLHLNQSKGTVSPVFSSDEVGSTFECHWTRWGRCRPAARTWHIRPASRHYFRVRARDAAGNVDPTPAKAVVASSP